MGTPALDRYLTSFSSISVLLLLPANMLRYICLGLTLVAVAQGLLNIDNKCTDSIMPPVEDMDKIAEACSEGDPSEVINCVAKQLDWISKGKLDDEKFVKYWAKLVKDNQELAPEIKKKLAAKLTIECSQLLEGKMENIVDTLECAASVPECQDDEEE